MKGFLSALAGVFVLLVSINSFADSPMPQLTKVDNQKMCMVNDAYFGSNQIPVPVGNKVYYGCCENCKKTLAQDQTARLAIDPITQKSVDKSTAVIGAASSGKVFYFENEANLKLFNAQK